MGRHLSRDICWLDDNMMGTSHIRFVSGDIGMKIPDPIWLRESWDENVTRYYMGRKDNKNNPEYFGINPHHQPR